MNAWDIKREAALPMWQARVRACRSSGMAVKNWCAANGIDRRTYYKWESYCISRAEQSQPSALIATEEHSLVRIDPE